MNEWMATVNELKPTGSTSQNSRPKLSVIRNDCEKNIPKQELCRGCKGMGSCKQSPPGMIPVEIEEMGQKYEVLRMCKYERQRREQAKINRLFRDSQVPIIYSADSWNDYAVNNDNRAAVSIAQQIAKNSGRLPNRKSVLFYGRRGCGKTKLAAIITNELIKQGESVLFTSVPDLLAQIRRSYDVGNTQEVIKGAQNADILILDDLGTERMNAWVSEQLYLIVNARYNNDRTTLVTTNYGPEQLTDRLTVTNIQGKVIDEAPSERIMSRLYAMCKFVEIRGGDRRI